MGKDDETELKKKANEALGGNQSDFHVLIRSDGAKPVALLATRDRPGGDLLVPLKEGKNIVGRSGDSRNWPKPYAVEQAQWLIDCVPSPDAPSEHVAHVWDPGSTNQSYLVPHKTASQLRITNPRAVFDELANSPGAVLLPHPNQTAEQHTFELGNGDVLCSFYATFLFFWL